MRKYERCWFKYSEVPKFKEKRAVEFEYSESD